MADLKITQSTADTTPQGADLITSVKSPFGAGSNRKITVANFVGNIPSPVGIGVAAQTFGTDMLDVRGDTIFESDIFTIPVIAGAGPPATAALASPAAPGNLESGVHRYVVTFLTLGGHETNVVALTFPGATIVNNAVNGQIKLTGVPVSPNPAVIARKIYRDNLGAPGIFLYVGIINDNTTTIYTDNTAPGSLGGQPPTYNLTGNFSVYHAAIENLAVGTLDVVGNISCNYITSNSGYVIPGGVFSVDDTGALSTKTLYVGNANEFAVDIGGSVQAENLDVSQNISFGSNLFSADAQAGSGAMKTLIMGNGSTPPTDSEDAVHMFCKDISAGRATFGIFSEEPVAIDAGLLATHSYTVWLNVGGTLTKVKLLAALA